MGQWLRILLLASYALLAQSSDATETPPVGAEPSAVTVEAPVPAAAPAQPDQNPRVTGETLAPELPPQKTEEAPPPFAENAVRPPSEPLLTACPPPQAPTPPADENGAGNEDAALIAALVTRISTRDLARIVQQAAENPALWPRLAALLLARNHHGDARRAVQLLENFMRQPPQKASAAVQLLLLLARERENRGGTRHGSAPSCVPSELKSADENNDLNALRAELAEVRKDREIARHEIIELRRKLKDITSIEKSMDERKAH